MLLGNGNKVYLSVYILNEEMINDILASDVKTFALRSGLALNLSLGLGLGSGLDLGSGLSVGSGLECYLVLRCSSFCQ